MRAVPPDVTDPTVDPVQPAPTVKPAAAPVATPSMPAPMTPPASPIPIPAAPAVAPATAPTHSHPIADSDPIPTYGGDQPAYTAPAPAPVPVYTPPPAPPVDSTAVAASTQQAGMAQHPIVAPVGGPNDATPSIPGGLIDLPPGDSFGGGPPLDQGMLPPGGLVGATDMGGQALPNMPTLATASGPINDPRYPHPRQPEVADPNLGSYTLPGDQQNAGDAERAYQQATNPALGGDPTKVDQAAAIYKQETDPTQSYVPSQRFQDAQQAAQAAPPTVFGSDSAPPPVSTIPSDPFQPAPPPTGDNGPVPQLGDALAGQATGGAYQPPVTAPPLLQLAPPPDQEQRPLDQNMYVPPADTGSPGGVGGNHGDDGAPQSYGGAGGSLDSSHQTAPPLTSDQSAIMPPPPAVTPAASLAPDVAPVQNQTPAVAPAAPPTVPGVSTSPLDPNGGLLNASILPDANAPDRVKLAQTEFQNYLDQQLPEYQAKLRGAFSDNAAMGRLGSGQLATSIGDLDLAAQRDANAKMSDLTTAATTGTIADRQQALANAKDERNYEANRSDTAYGQGVNNLNLEDALTNSAFGRALAQHSAGQANSPTTTEELLSQIFGQQATGAGNALGNLVKANASNNTVNAGTAPASGGGLLSTIFGAAPAGSTGGPADASAPFDINAWMKANGIDPTTVMGSDAGNDYGVAP